MCSKLLRSRVDDGCSDVGASTWDMRKKAMKEQKKDSQNKKMSEKSLELQKKIERSPFSFGTNNGEFVPVYGPFAWTPDDLRKCRSSVSGSTVL